LRFAINAINGNNDSVASITIRNLDDRLKARLRVRAARNGRSMEDEAREIMRQVLAGADAAPRNLASSIRRRFSKLGGVELELADREPMREPPAIEP
jgi:plasmid stability protein